MRIVSRVSLWGLCLFIWAGVAAAAPSSADIDAARAEYVEQWEEYKRRFLLPDGRIEDTNEGTPSHVEGQGSAMIFATVARDREAFDLIWGWTRDTLWERHGLFAWRYLPNEEVKVPDRNNATDGDLLILWGLMRAAKLWDEPAFDEAADKIILGLERRAIFDVGERKVLLPGALAFRKDDGAILNLSYFLFEPIQWAMERRDNAIWRQTYQDAIEIVREARFGDHGLPSAWLYLTDEGMLQPAEKHRYRPRFGYDAIRIPIYITWGGVEDEADLARFESYWSEYPVDAPPDYVDFSQNRVSDRRDVAGARSIRAMTRNVLALKDDPDAERVPHPKITRWTNYYSAMLTLLARGAEIDRLEEMAARE